MQDRAQSARSAQCGLLPRHQRAWREGKTQAPQGAGHRMLQAVIYYGDNLVVSEQFDVTTGYEKSTSQLSRSYASSLSAAHAKNAT